jgi:hypothetical protein
MMPLSEYRRKKAQHMNTAIDKRCSRKLEFNLGWSDQTEVFYLLNCFNFAGGISWHLFRGISLFQKSCYPGTIHGYGDRHGFCLFIRSVCIICVVNRVNGIESKCQPVPSTLRTWWPRVCRSNVDSGWERGSWKDSTQDGPGKPHRRGTNEIRSTGLRGYTCHRTRRILHRV